VNYAIAKHYDLLRHIERKKFDVMHMGFYH